MAETKPTTLTLKKGTSIGSAEMAGKDTQGVIDALRAKAATVPPVAAEPAATVPPVAAEPVAASAAPIARFDYGLRTGTDEFSLPLFFAHK